jgi:competence protein ComEC
MQLVATRGTRVSDRVDAWVEAESGRFFLVLPVLMTVGAVWYFYLRQEPPPWSGAAAAALALVPAILLRQLLVPRAMAHMAVAVAIGFASAQAATRRMPPVIEVPSKATLVSGTVAAVENLPTGRRVLIHAPHFDKGPAQRRDVRIRLRPADATPLEAGDRLTLRALLSRPAPPAYPGGWDLQRDAFFAGIGAYGYALNPVQTVESAPVRRLQWLRETIATRIGAVLNGSTAAIAVTLLTGSPSAIPEPDRAAFRDSGLAHLLAIAGLHIGIVMGLCFGATRIGLAWCERTALHWPGKTIAALAALAAGGGYLALTGAHVPILRSFAMACLVTLGVLAGRRALSLRGLGLAMAAIVLIAPWEVVGVSFQMSFSAVLALIAGYDLLRPWLIALHVDGTAGRRFLGHLAALALTSALAGSFSAPYAAYHFGQVQLYFVLANMAAVPLTAMLAMPAGLIALALMPLHLEALALVPMGWGIDAIIWIARTVAAWPAATLAVPHAPIWGLAVFSLGLAWVGIWRSRMRLAGLVAMALGLVSPLTERPADILVSADARLIAYRSQGQMLVQAQNGGARFTQDAWQQYWAAPPPVALDCPTPNCLLQPRPNDPAALLVRADADTALCTAALLISAQPIRLECPTTVPLIDRFTVWREGAQAVWLGPDGVHVLSDRTVRGTRPWVLGLPLASRVPANTVPAPTEDLPAP